MKKNIFGRISMDAQSRMKTNTIASAVALAMLQMAAVAHADSGVGQDTIISNSFSKRAINTTTNARTVDPEGMGTNSPVARTPSGQMYDMPLSPTDEIGKTQAGWDYIGFIEGGLLTTSGDKKAQGFKRYKDPRSGFYLSEFGLSMEKKDAANFFEVTGGAVSHDDQFYTVQFGRYNDWKVRGFYNETQHVFTTSFRSIYDGIGSGDLRLKSGLTPGGTAATATDNANVANVANANANTEIGLLRQKGGVRFDMNLTDAWTVFATYTNEKRTGARPFGSVWGGGGGTAPVETLEPINYNTHDLMAGAQYNDELNSLNLQFSASWFRNNIDTLTFQTPYREVAAVTNGVAIGGFTQGRFDLYPNNDYYNLKGEYARSLPNFYNGRFTATMALATSRQDDKLIPYTTIPGVTIANVTTAPGAGCARIDTRLLNLGLALNPITDLNVAGKLRYYETKNHTDYLACNPNATYTDVDPVTAGAQAGGLSAYGCNGVWGRVLNDGSGAAVVNPLAAAGNVNIRNIPFDYKQWIYGLSGDYRLGKTASLNASYERETYDRDHREREKTWEDKYKVGYVNRAIENATLRMSFEHDRRRGDEYHTHHPYADYYSGYILPMPTAAGSNVQTWVVHMNQALRKYDLADRNQNILNARVNYMVAPELDLGFSGQLKDTRYPDSEMGRTDTQTQHSLNFDANYQPSAERSLYGFYSYQEGKLKQKGNVSGAIAAGAIAPAQAVLGCTIGTVTPLGVITAANAEAICQNSASGTVWLLANGWDATHKDTSNMFGLGWKEQFGDKLLDLNYTYSRSKTDISYTPAGGTTVTAAALAGSGMPSLTSVQHIFEANLLIPINKSTSTRVVLRHEIGKITDWHYTNLQSTPVAGAAGALPTAVILDAGPQDYRATMLGVMFNFKM